MSSPVPYTVSYSFAGYQAIHPADPLPAADLDNELAGVEAFSTSVIAALAEVRRADGHLQDGSVTLDALDDDVLALLQGVTDRVTVGDLNASAFANQPEAEAGVANDKILTPLRATQLLDALRAFSDQSTAEAGVSSTVVLSPLRAKQMLDALRALASQAEAQAGTNNTKVMTPLRVVEALAALRPAFTLTQSLTWGAISAGASAEQTLTVTGAAVGDRVVLGLPANFPAGIVANGYVSATNTVKIRFTNITGSPITPYSGAATSHAVTALRF